MADYNAYTFCETSRADIFTPWHIRREGNSRSLCDVRTSRDVRYLITEKMLSVACPKCRAELKRREAAR